MRILALDIEGGFGGSSRSLFELIRHLDRARATADVWCAKAGPIQGRYQACGVSVEVRPDMPRYSALPRLSRNLLTILRYAINWAGVGKFRSDLLARAKAYDVIHFNHEALWPIAVWLRKQVPDMRMSMHIRTMLHDSLFARLQCRFIASTVDDVIFITENERENFCRHTSGSGIRKAARARRHVIYNIAEPPSIEPDPWVGLERSAYEFRVACLSNYAWIRGVDRLLDIAEELRSLGRSDIVFVVAGRMALSRSLPGDLGAAARQGLSLSDVAEARGLSPWFRFLGHVNAPERVLVVCDALIKPTREDNPWGRDILEALAMGRPVISVGHYNRFVEDGVTGILQPRFNPRDVAFLLMTWAAHPDQAVALGAAGRDRISTLCRGRDRAEDVLRIWQAD